MTYSSTFSTFTRPNPSDRLNNPSHSALHNATSSAVGQLEAVVGLAGDSSVLGTVIGDLRSPNSNGGGHVQTANKGGTGQTTYTKGDLLVATSSSVLSKLAVGTDGQALIADSTQAAGVKYAAFLPKIIASVISSTLQASVTETSIFSVPIPASTLGNSNVVVATLYLSRADSAAGTASVMLRGTYGGARVASVLLTTLPESGTGTSTGVVNMTLLGQGASNSQRMILNADIRTPYPAGITSVVSRQGINTASVVSGGVANIGMTAQWSTGGSNNNALTYDSVIIQSITGT